MEQPAEAIRESEAALVLRDGVLAKADSELAAILTQAHLTVVVAMRRLDAIEDEIESAVSNQDTMALDTPAGALSFHQFLLTKQQEIRAIVSDAYAEDGTHAATMESLLSQYSTR